MTFAATIAVLPLENPRHVLRCHCCNRPFAYEQNGVLVIESRHGSDTHTNVLTLEDVERLLKRGG